MPAEPTLPPDETTAAPYCVPPGWLHGTVIETRPFHAGRPMRLLSWSDTEIGVEHRCDRGPRGVIVCAPRLTAVGRPGGHQVTWTPDGPTVVPSILCPDCGLHGYITSGRWRDA